MQRIVVLYRYNKEGGYLNENFRYYFRNLWSGNAHLHVRRRVNSFMGVGESVSCSWLNC